VCGFSVCPLFVVGSTLMRAVQRCPGVYGSSSEPGSVVTNGGGVTLGPGRGQAASERKPRTTTKHDDLVRSLLRGRFEVLEQVDGSGSIRLKIRWSLIRVPAGYLLQHANPAQVRIPPGLKPAHA
jgi:hypothetical protein